MKRTLTTGALLALGATSAGAVGLDRSNQDITVIFEEGTYGQFSIATTSPDVSGFDDSASRPGTASYDDVGDDYTQLSFGYKQQLNDKFSVALIGDQPFGAAISYEGDSPTNFGGTVAQLKSSALTAVGRYQINDRFSVHAGLRRETLQGEVTLSGFAYGLPSLPTLNGYHVDLEADSATGYVAGAAYEIPEIALRVALTYNSSMTHEFDAQENIQGIPASVLNPALDTDQPTEVETPEAWNLDFQTGVAEGTLVFGSIRHATYSQTKVSPPLFKSTGNGSLTDIEDNTSYSLGVGRQITPNFAASISVGYTPEGEDDLVSPLAPTNGQKSIQIGGEYTMDKVTLSAGIRYTMLGDAHPETGTPDEQHATFEDNSATSFGMSIGYQF